MSNKGPCGVETGDVIMDGRFRCFAVRDEEENGERVVKSVDSERCPVRCLKIITFSPKGTIRVVSGRKGRPAVRAERVVRGAGKGRKKKRRGRGRGGRQVEQVRAQGPKRTVTFEGLDPVESEHRIVAYTHTRYLPRNTPGR